MGIGANIRKIRKQIEQYDGGDFFNNVNQQGGQYIAKQYVSQEWVDILQSTISTLAEAQKNQQLILNAVMETNQQQQLMIGTLMKDLMKIKGDAE